MIVVAIIGILAAIAIPNFLNFRLKAKAAEAKTNLGAIRTGEIAFFAEWNSYVGNQPPVPVANRAHVPGTKPYLGADRLSLVGFMPAGEVYYSYSLSPNVDFPTTGFTAHAIGDLDDDGFTADFFINGTDNAIQKTGAAF
jgi:type IV pilus assembly protein PilA